MKNEAPHPNGWNEMEKATKDWYYDFMQRNKNLSLRKPTPMSMSRAKGFCKENVDDFFNNLEAELKEYNFPAHRQWNCDESGFPIVPPKPGKVVVAKGSSRVGKAASAERGTNVSMCLSVSAAGLFPRKNFKPIDNATHDHAIFCRIFHTLHQAHMFVTCSMFPTLLIMDNHTSHLSVEVIDLADENGVTIVTLRLSKLVLN